MLQLIRARPVLLLPCLVLALGCNEIDLSALVEGGNAVIAEKPEGWESLDDAESASRLYYQFVDARGRVRFVERMADVPEQWRANVGFVKMAVPPPLSPGDAARARKSSAAPRPAIASAAPESEILLYSAEWCGACKKAKRYLSRNGIDYDERNVDTRRYADELVEKTGRRSIPVIDVDGRVFTGFDPGAYDSLIAS
jgi:glutaredoxin